MTHDAFELPDERQSGWWLWARRRVGSASMVCLGLSLLLSAPLMAQTDTPATPDAPPAKEAPPVDAQKAPADIPKPPAETVVVPVAAPASDAAKASGASVKLAVPAPAARQRNSRRVRNRTAATSPGATAKSAVSKAATAAAAKAAAQNAAKASKLAKAVAPSMVGLNAVGAAGNKAKLPMNFQGVSIDNVLNFFSVWAGQSIIKDSNLTGTITLIAPVPITLDQGLSMLNAWLDSKGFSLDRQSGFMQVRVKGSGGPSGNRGPGGATPNGMDLTAMGGGLGQGSGTTLDPKVYRLKYANAAALATIITSLYPASPTTNQPQVQGGRGGRFPMGATRTTDVKVASDDQTNSLIVVAADAQLQQIEALIEDLDTPGTSSRPPTILKVQYVDATQIAPTITTVLTSSSGGQGGGPPWMRRGGGTSVIPDPKITADESTNSLVVIATDPQITQIKAILKELDVEARPTREPKVYKLKYVAADQMVQVVTSVLNSTQQTSTNQNSMAGFAGMGGFRGGFRNQGSSGSYGTTGLVSSHAETNTLVVTATAKQLKAVDEVVKKLDVPQQPKSSTMVYNINNASATEIADLLTSTFGRRTGSYGNSSYGNRNSNSSYGNTNRNNNSSNRNNNSFGNSNSFGSGSTMRSITIGG